VVFGFLKKKKEKASTGDLTQSITKPLGRITDNGYIPDPRELAIAIPIPPVGEWWNPRDVGLSQEEAGWPIVMRKEWRPRRVRSSGEYLREIIWRPEYKFPFYGMVWANGRVYLVGAFTYAILRKADGSRIAEEIMSEILSEIPKYLDENYSLKIALEKPPERRTDDEQKEVIGFINALYFQMALLRKLGLLI